MNLRNLVVRTVQCLLAGMVLGGVLRAGESELVAAGDARAGWSEIDITPPLGIALGGRGAVMTVSKQVLAPLVAQVLVLRDAKGAGLVLVSMDLIGLPHEFSERVRKAIVQETGAEWSLVVLNTSHTHSGPNMLRSLVAGAEPPPQVETDYFNELLGKVIHATRAAVESIRPVSVEVFEGSSLIGINRRGKNAAGQTGMIPDQVGPIDPKLWVMKLTPADGSPSAVMFAHACHPVIVYGYAFAAISPDFPGVTREVLRERLGAETHVQFVQGFAGNVRPRVLADIEAKRFRPSTPGDVLATGRQLAEDILATLAAPSSRLSLDLAGAMDRPFLPRGAPPSREIYEKIAQGVDAPALRVAEFWLERYDSGRGFARGDAWPVGLIRLSKQHWIAYLAGEPCAEWRPAIENWLAPRKVVTWGYTQEANTYLPTEALLPEGGYEVVESNRARANSPAPFATGIEKSVRSSLLRQLAFIEAGVE